MNEEQLKAVAEQFKASLSLEELDELERRYNEMLMQIKVKRDMEEIISGSTTKLD